MPAYLLQLLTTESNSVLKNGANAFVGFAADADDMKAMCKAKYSGQSNAAFDSAIVTEIAAAADLENWRVRVAVLDPVSPVDVMVVGEAAATVDSIGAQLVTALNATAGIAAASYNSSTNLLTISQGAGYQEVGVGGNKNGASATGLANDATVYTATVSVNGEDKAVAITGSTAQTYTNLLSQLNTDLDSGDPTGATASLVGGNIRITSNTEEAPSTIEITDGDLFATLTGFTAVGSAVAGELLGDNEVLVEFYPPASQAEDKTAVPSFIGTVTHEGDPDDNLSVVLTASTPAKVYAALTNSIAEVVTP